jgi:hypothetical protein
MLALRAGFDLLRSDGAVLDNGLPAQDQAESADTAMGNPAAGLQMSQARQPKAIPQSRRCFDRYGGRGSLQWLEFTAALSLSPGQAPTHDHRHFPEGKVAALMTPPASGGMPETIKWFTRQKGNDRAREGLAGLPRREGHPQITCVRPLECNRM